MTQDTEQAHLPDIDVVEADVPYGRLPSLPEGGEMLGWYHHSEPHNDGPRILLSDVCQGEPPIEEVVKVVSHEYLHHVIDVLVSKHVSQSIDNLVDDGNFIIERPENGVKDDRPMEEKW